MPPLSLYVHLPWCVHKCPYCDFNSHAVRGDLPETRYLMALLEDLDQESERAGQRALTSIFFGGGTPSLFSAAAIGALIDRVATKFELCADIEISLEANPGTLESAPLEAYREVGVNRLSLGVQSFDDQMLKKIGRIHGGQEARQAIESAHRAGFENLNIDLMYGLPEQTPEQAMSDIETAMAYAPTHVSHYQLTIEPNTYFDRHRPALPDSDRCWEMQLRCQQRLAEAGYAQYEVSAYSKAGRRCRHNLNYWQFGDYLAIGAGAHGKLTDPESAAVVRYWKQRHPRQYMETVEQGSAVGGEHQVGPKDLAFEFVLNAFRLNDGVPASLFAQRTGLPLDRSSGPWHEALSKGWLEDNAEQIRPTGEGRRLLNDLTELFLP
jgi:oxygen-independent coproporphyrinogen-3 oxidase